MVFPYEGPGVSLSAHVLFSSMLQKDVENHYSSTNNETRTSYWRSFPIQAIPLEGGAGYLFLDCPQRIGVLKESRLPAGQHLKRDGNEYLSRTSCGAFRG